MSEKGNSFREKFNEKFKHFFGPIVVLTTFPLTSMIKSGISTTFIRLYNQVEYGFVQLEFASGLLNGKNEFSINESKFYGGEMANSYGQWLDAGIMEEYVLELRYCIDITRRIGSDGLYYDRIYDMEKQIRELRKLKTDYIVALVSTIFFSIFSFVLLSLLLYALFVRIKYKEKAVFFTRRSKKVKNL